MSLIGVVRATRYLVLLPIIGLAVAAAVLFVFGGIGMVGFVFENMGQIQQAHSTTVLPLFELLEYVHQFLIGTVLYITAMGLYQLFIQHLELPGWLKIESAEDLETNLIGVTVVVLAIEFLGVVFGRAEVDLLNYGAGIALPIAALALFMAAKHIILPRKTASGLPGRHSESEAGEHSREPSGTNDLSAGTTDEA